MLASNSSLFIVSVCVKAYGAGLATGTVSKPADFTIDTRMAGPGSLGLTIDGPTEAKIECFDKGGGLFDVRYWPTEPGEYTTNILYDDKPIPQSPFRAQVNPAKMVDVSGVKVYGNGVEPTGMYTVSQSIPPGNLKETQMHSAPHLVSYVRTVPCKVWQRFLWHRVGL